MDTLSLVFKKSISDCRSNFKLFTVFSFFIFLAILLANLSFLFYNLGYFDDVTFVFSVVILFILPSFFSFSIIYASSKNRKVSFFEAFLSPFKNFLSFFLYFLFLFIIAFLAFFIILVIIFFFNKLFGEGFLFALFFIILFLVFIVIFIFFFFLYFLVFYSLAIDEKDIFYSIKKSYRLISRKPTILLYLLGVFIFYFLFYYVIYILHATLFLITFSHFEGYSLQELSLIIESEGSFLPLFENLPLIKIIYYFVLYFAWGFVFCLLFLPFFLVLIKNIYTFFDSDYSVKDKSETENAVKVKSKKGKNG